MITTNKRNLSMRTIASFFFILFISKTMTGYAGGICPQCGKNTKYSSCYEYEYIKNKAISMLKGCTNYTTGVKLSSQKESTSSRNKRIEEKLMIEFCNDPANDQSTACDKFHYSRIGKAR